MLRRCWRSFGQATGAAPHRSTALQVIQQCLETQALRNELYVQIIKQLSRNPRDLSKQRGWILLELVLESFPPGESLENYVEWFIRCGGRPLPGAPLGAPAAALALTPGRRSEHNGRCLMALHRTVYSGAVEAAPSLEAVRAACLRAGIPDDATGPAGSADGGLESKDGGSSFDGDDFGLDESGGVALDGLMGESGDDFAASRHSSRHGGDRAFGIGAGLGRTATPPGAAGAI